MGTDWPASEQEGNRDGGGEGAGGQHLWEDSWDDDDTNEEFSKQLKWVCFEIVGEGLLMRF